MLRVVPVESVASGVECLVVLCIEVGVGKVEGVLQVFARHFDVGGYGIELGVGGDDVLLGELLSAACLVEPAANLLSLAGRCFGVVDGKQADGSVFLNCLSAHLAAVGIQIGEREVGFLNEVHHVVDGDVVERDGYGGHASGVVAIVADVAHRAGDWRSIADGVGGRNHRLALRQLDGCLVDVAIGLEHVVGIIIHAVGLERCQHGNFLLCAVEHAFNHDVGEANLFVIGQSVEVDDQSASALIRCGVLDFVAESAV